MNKNPKQTEMTKKNFQDAFWTLYTKNNIDKITIKDLCRLAGYNRSTFYQYFTDVYDLLHQFENMILQDMNEFLIMIVKETESLTISQIITYFFELLAKYSKYTAVLFGPHGDVEFTHRIVEDIKPLWKKYYFRTDHHTTEEVDLLMEYHISGVLAMYQKWSFDPKGISDERFLQIAIQTLPSNGVFENLGKQLPNNESNAK